MNTKTVFIPRVAQHNGWDSAQVTVKWRCPVCGGPRGKVRKVRSYDGSLALWCHGWTNPCGHVDKYEDVVAEGMAENEPAPDDWKLHDHTDYASLAAYYDQVAQDAR